MNPIRFGLIGCSPIGHIHAKVITENPNAKLISVTDSNLKKAKEVSESFSANVSKSIEDLVQHPQIDVVSICLPHHLHYSACLSAIKAKKHILIEKPLALSIDQGQDIISKAEEAGIKLGVIFQNRFVTEFQQLKQLIKDGVLGKINLVDIDVKWLREKSYFDNSWRNDKYKAGGGVLVTQAIHFLDLALHLFGPVVEVNCTVQNLRKWMEVEDLAVGQILFNEGLLGNFVTSTAISLEEPARLTIHGSLDSATFIENRGYTKLVIHDSVENERNINLHQDSSVPSLIESEGHEFLYKDFIHAIRNDNKPIIDGYEGLKSLFLLEALYKSAENRKWATVGKHSIEN